MKKAMLGAIAVGAAIGALNLAHYFTTKQVRGVEAPFGLFPGGFPVAASLGLSGKDLSPDLVAMLVLGVGILAGSLLSARLSGDLTLSKLRAKKLSAAKLRRATLGGVLMGLANLVPGISGGTRNDRETLDALAKRRIDKASWSGMTGTVTLTQIDYFWHDKPGLLVDSVGDDDLPGDKPMLSSVVYDYENQTTTLALER